MHAKSGTACCIIAEFLYLDLPFQPACLPYTNILVRKALDGVIAERVNAGDHCSVDDAPSALSDTFL